MPLPESGLVEGQSGQFTWAYEVGKYLNGIGYWLNDPDYGGAAATAGTTMNNILAAMPATGGRILVPAGTWTINTAVLWTKAQVVIEGVGAASILQFDGNTVPIAFKMADTTVRRGIKLRNLRILQSGTGTVGTVVDASYCANAVFDGLDIDGSSGATNAPNKGVIYSVSGTHYNLIADSRILAAGAGSQALAYTGLANSNIARNIRVVGTASLTGVFADAQSILLDRVDVETAAAVGIDIGANARDIVLVAPYLEGNVLNLRLGAGAESVAVYGGQLLSGTTANIQDNGSRGLTIDAQVEFDPFTYYGSVNGGPQQRHLWPSYGGNAIPGTSQTAVAGRVYLSMVEVPNGAVVDAVGWTNAATVAGNVTAGLYGPTTKAAEETDVTGLPVVATSTSAATTGANTPQFATFAAKYLRPGRYYAAVEFSDATHTFFRHDTISLIGGLARSYDRGGGYGTLTDPAPTAAANTTIPALRLRCVALASV